MKITQNILSIPPYLSTTWDQIGSLHIKDLSLIVTLKNGFLIAIPGLTQQEIESVFTAHAAYLDTTAKGTQNHPGQSAPFHIMQALSGNPSPSSSSVPEEMIPLRLNLDNMESLASSLQHNPAQAHLPELPKEIVTKIAAIAKIIAPDEIQNMPKPEPHCNCPHCQILRAIRGENKGPALEEAKEEEVSEADLSFQEWDIKQAGDKLYLVTNKLDPQENFRVFLGDPVGCTCGIPGCEHILAVLKS